MTTTQAAELRIKWEQRVDPPPCEHLNLELERSGNGYLPLTVGIISSEGATFVLCSGFPTDNAVIVARLVKTAAGSGILSLAYYVITRVALSVILRH